MNGKNKHLAIRENWGKPKPEYFNFRQIGRYFRNNTNTECLQRIDNRTIDDIDFEELFMFADRTNSKIGQQYLYDKLLTIHENNDFDEQEKLIDYFLQNEQARTEAQLLLSKLNKDDAYYISALFQDEYIITKPKWFWLIPTLSAASILSFILTFVFPGFIFLLIPVLVINLLFHYWNKKNIYMYTDSIPQLLILLRISKEFLRNHPDNQATLSLKSLEAQKKAMSVFLIESKTDSDLGIIIWTALEYIKIFFLIEPLAVFRVMKKLDKKRDDIHTLFRYIGRIDTAIALASLRTGLAYFCKPKIAGDTENVLSFDEIYHPLITGCISNSICIADKSVLLTGSNMSGKTTFIRTVAINVLCAQTINTCFANRFAIKPTRLYSAIRIADDLMNDKSYYFEEVLTIKHLINESRADCHKLFLLDEIFKGTNTVERIAAGKAVLSYLGKGNNLVFVSTHDIELTDLLKGSYALYHFTETVEDNTIYFDYKLKEGNLATRNAIRILELNDYPAEVIEEAKAISGSNDPKIS